MAKKKKKEKDDAEGGEDEKKKGGLPIKKIGIGLVVAFVVYTKVLSGGGEAEAGEPTETTMAEPVPGVIMDTGSIRVSLADTEPHYALVSIGVQIEESADLMLVENKMPLLLDAAVAEVSNFNVEQLKGKSGSDFLKKILFQRAEEILNIEGEQVVALQIVITELVVQ